MNENKPRSAYEFITVAGQEDHSPNAVNRLSCATYEVLRSVDLRSHRLDLSFVCGYFHASFHIATG